MKKKKIGFVEIFSIIIIVCILGLLIIPSINSIASDSQKNTFLTNIDLVYNESLNKREKGIESGLSPEEYNNQFSRFLFENGYEIKYAATYDDEGNMTYLCISDNSFVVELPSKEGYVSKDEFTVESIREETKDCFKEATKDDEE